MTMLLVMSDVVLPLAEIKKRLSEIIDGVEDRHDRVVLTRHGRPAAVIISPDDLEALEETLDLLSDPNAVREIREETGYATGVEVLDLGRWVEFVSPLTGRTFRKRCLGALLPAAAGPATVRMCEEHEEARLVTFDEARALVRFPEIRVEISTFEAWLSARRARV